MKPSDYVVSFDSSATMMLEQLRPYYQGVYFATVSMKKKVADEGLE